MKFGSKIYLKQTKAKYAKQKSEINFISSKLLLLKQSSIYFIKFVVKGIILLHFFIWRSLPEE